MHVRRADLADLPAVTPLFDQYRGFYGFASDLPRATAFLSERLERQDSVVLVAEQEDALLGFTQLYPLFSSTETRRSFMLNDLFVAPAARGRGVAQALLAEARRVAEADGACEMLLQTAVDNRTAQGLYEHAGWQRDDDFYVYQLQL